MCRHEITEEYGSALLLHSNFDLEKSKVRQGCRNRENADIVIFCRNSSSNDPIYLTERPNCSSLVPLSLRCMSKVEPLNGKDSNKCVSKTHMDKHGGGNYVQHPAAFQGQHVHRRLYSLLKAITSIALQRPRDASCHRIFC